MKQGQGQLKIRVKYCGGCNPNYDRVALVGAIEARLSGKASFVATDSNGIAMVLAVVGCSTACADLSAFEGQEIRVITSLEEAELFIHDLAARAS